MEGRTVESLGRVRYVRDAEVGCEHQHAGDNINERSGRGIGEEELEERKEAIHCVHGEVFIC
jgi:hypothetical protein